MKKKNTSVLIAIHPEEARTWCAKSWSKQIWQEFKFWVFFFFSKTQHTKHFLMLVNKLCKFEMDLASIVQDTERTWFGLQTDGGTDGRTDKVKPVYPTSNPLAITGDVINTALNVPNSVIISRRTKLDIHQLKHTRLSTFNVTFNNFSQHTLR